jgi:type IV pilus assembly protein PilY1
MRLIAVTEHRAQRHAIQMSVLALLLAPVSLAWTAENIPSQTPLLNRTNLVPAPNVMLTLDDSGSMTYQYLPERTFRLNGQEVQFPNDGKVYLHPRELTENRFTFKDSGYSETRYVTATNFALSGNTAMQLTQAQMRSPQVNKLYYNPYLTYKPWTTAAGREYLPASPSKAWLRPERLLPDIRLPQVETDYVDLTSETGTHSVQWYCREDGHWTGCGRSTALAYSPALLYMLNDGANPNEVSSYVAYNLNTTSSFTWPAGPHKAKRDDCTKSSDGNSYTCTQDQEQKNFANWFVFYRSRLLVAQGTIPEALQSSVGDIRLGWGTIHPRQIKTNESETWTAFRPDHDITGAPNVPSYTVQQGVRTLNSAHLTEFTNWIRNDIKPERRTPTLNAVYSVGEYFKREDRLSPWQNDMTADPVSSPPFECRRSFHLLVTDGYYQSHEELSNAGDNMFVTAGMSSLPEVGNADANATADDSTFSGSRDSQGETARPQGLQRQSVKHSGGLRHVTVAHRSAARPRRQGSADQF